MSNIETRKFYQISRKIDWLRSADYAQTPQSELISYLLERFTQVKWALLTFKGFTFTPKQPTKALTL